MNQAVTDDTTAKEMNALNKSNRAIVTAPATVITITSGKGGVGKTNLTTNLAIALAQRGKKVLIFDADLGLANVDVMLGLTVKKNIHDVLEGRKILKDIVMEGPGGIGILPASSGIQKLVDLSTEEKLILTSQLTELSESLDYILIDTGAGISSNVVYFNLASHNIIVVITPEPTSITDAYALIKVLSQNYRQQDFHIVINEAQNAREAQQVFGSLTQVTDKFLDISIHYLGFLYRDAHVLKAIRRQRAVIDVYPESSVSKSIKELSDEINAWPPPDSFNGGQGLML